MMLVDFLRDPWRRSAMDEDSAELIRQLYTRAGMTMEDASVIALELGAPRSTFDPNKIQKLEETADTIVQLTKAARSIVE
jgi:succinylglutamate desuccinylase